MKERLLGAAVLIAVAILLIPALLDGPQPSNTVSRELALPVPDSDNPVPASVETTRTHTVEIGTGEAETESGQELTAFVDEPSPPPAIPPAPAPSGAAADKMPGSATKPEVAKEPVTKPVPSVTGWAVQVGSFSSESNARRLMEHLKDAGYPAFVVRNVVNGRVMFRVRVGPESDRLRAEALLDRLKSDRQQTQLVRHP